jgi:hypothetical protein
LAVRASHLFATSAVTAEALLALATTAIQAKTASALLDFRLAGMVSPFLAGRQPAQVVRLTVIRALEKSYRPCNQNIESDFAAEFHHKPCFLPNAPGVTRSVPRSCARKCKWQQYRASIPRNRTAREACGGLSRF